MLALSFHLFLYFYCRRKFWVYNQCWYSVFTYWYLGLYFLFILAYWTGDFEYFTFSLIYKNLILSAIIIYLTLSAFNVFWMVKEWVVFSYTTREYMDIYSQNSVYIYFYYLKNDLKLSYLNFLKNEWYKYQLNYNRYIKSPFIYFLYVFSLFAMIFQIMLFYYYFYFFFFFIHYPLTAIYIRVEFSKFRIIFIFLISIFIYYLIISIFLPNTKGLWIFFFIKYHFKWRFVDMVYFIEQDVLFYTYDMPTLESFFAFNNYFQCKLNKGYQKRNIKKGNWIVLFNSDFINDRFWIPAPWRTLKYSDISCFVNSFFFKYWINKLDLIIYFVFPYQLTNYTVICNRYLFGFATKLRETISYRRRGTADYSVKRYKFK